MDKPSVDGHTLDLEADEDPSSTMDAASDQAAAAPTEPPGTAAAANDDDDDDRPIRVLVQTRTRLVPGDKWDPLRREKMQDLICQHVWKRAFDRFRERGWQYKCHWAVDNVECWLLIDHHGPDPTPPPDPPVLWYRWTGTEFITVHDPLPRRVRREFRHYPSEKSPHLYKPPPPPGTKRPRRKFASRAEEIRVRRDMLRRTLLTNCGLTHNLMRFVRENPEAAEWVRVRVPPETWARLEDPDEWIGHTDSESEDDGVGPGGRLTGAEQLPEGKGGLGDEGKGGPGDEGKGGLVDEGKGGLGDEGEEGLRKEGGEGHGDEGPDAGG